MTDVMQETRQSVVRRWSRALGAWLGHESIPQMAAALAYRTIFSLIPILILSLLVLRLFQDERQLVSKMLGKALELAGISQLQLSGSAETSVQTRLEELVQSFSGLSFTGIGLVSAVTLIYAAISLIVEVENSFNRIYGAARGRSVVRRLTQYWLLLTLGPLLVFASFYTAEKFSAFGQALAQQSASVVGSWVLGVTGYVISVVISGTLLLVIYLIVPNARVQLKAAASGALIAGVLLELGKYGFRLYLDHAGYKSLYGSLALVPLFLLWIYITWVIVLFGLRSAYLIQHGHRLALMTVLTHGAGTASMQRWLEPSTVVLVAEQIARAFATGKPITLQELAIRSRLTDATTRQVIAPLREAGIVLWVDGPGERLSLSRPTESVRVATLLKIGHDLCGEPVGGEKHGSDDLARELRTAELKASGDRTLADVMQMAGAPRGETAAVAMAAPAAAAPAAG